MALGQVAARIEGDVFQGMFFWLQAAALLRPASGVVRVVLEQGVDRFDVGARPEALDAADPHALGLDAQIVRSAPRSTVGNGAAWIRISSLALHASTCTVTL